MHFITSKQIYSYRKLNLLLTNSIYIVFLPLEMQRKLKQTKVYHTFYQFVWKKMAHEPLKVASSKTLFSSVYVSGKSCFDECFLLHEINWKTLLFIKVIRFSEVILTAMLMFWLKPEFWKSQKLPPEVFYK